MEPPARLRTVVGFGIDRVAAQAAGDPEVLRLENLDTDIPPPAVAVDAVKQAPDDRHANSYLPFIGRSSLRDAVAARPRTSTGVPYAGDRNVVITAGGTEGIMAALLAVVDPGDEVVLTDPTYAGMIQRVTLAGATPVTVALHVDDRRWRLDIDRLAQAVGSRTRALLLMSPSMPSGHVYSEEDWRAVLDLCEQRDLWLLYDAAMERLVFDAARVVHPAAPPGPTQPGADAALGAGDGDGVASAVAELQRRRDTVLEQLHHLPLVIPDGGWSMLLDAAAMGTTPEDLSAGVLRHGKVAATPMRGWGDTVAPRYLRLVFSNEPVARLGQLRERFAAAGW